MENAESRRWDIFQYHAWNCKQRWWQSDWKNKLSKYTRWRYTVTVSFRTQLQYCNGYTALTANNKCLWPTVWLRYWIQLMFHSANMWAESTTQQTLAPEPLLLMNSREASGLLGRPGWSNQKARGLSKSTLPLLQIKRTYPRQSS